MQYVGRRGTVRECMFVMHTSLSLSMTMWLVGVEGAHCGVTVARMSAVPCVVCHSILFTNHMYK